MQFLMLAKDGTDKDALARRLHARERHIALGDEMKKNGTALFGVALLDESEKMNGSVYIVDFPSRQELENWLKKEPYMTEKVWEKIEIFPCRVGPSFLE